MSLQQLVKSDTEDGTSGGSKSRLSDKTKMEVFSGYEDYENDTTIHYLSPVSLTMTAINEEDRILSLSTTEFYRYLDLQQSDLSEWYGEAAEEASDYSVQYSKSMVSSIDEWQLERTLAIIKPDVVFYEEVIVRKIQHEGFKILQKRKVHLTPEQVSELYYQYYGNISFPYLVVTMSSGPIIALCLACTNAVEKWKNLIKDSGSIFNTWFYPKSMRLKYGLNPTLDGVLHASENVYTAKRELRFFFPKPIIEPLLQEENCIDYLQLKINPTLVLALTELCKKKPLEPIIYFAEWLLLNNPYQPKFIPEIAKLPT